MVFSRSVPQSCGQISELMPGQWRRAFRLLQIVQRIPSSYHREMRRTDVFLKVEIDLTDKAEVERVAQELCRMLKRAYGVRSAEVVSMVEKE